MPIVITVSPQSTPEKTLGVKLRVVRSSARLTQKQIGDAIGVSERVVGKMESGESLDALAVIRWVIHCGQSLDNIFNTKESV